MEHLEEPGSESRVVIHAVGALSARLRISADAAYAALREEAELGGRLLADVAREAVDLPRPALSPPAVAPE
ncbi:hypothetical protein B0T42_02155 [Rathayibacter sp. VKM Ac-2630]|nr:hypothetical protein B0T42_02155 [Rathayibacter sp. VKM Ac-2630]